MTQLQMQNDFVADVDSILFILNGKLIITVKCSYMTTVMAFILLGCDIVTYECHLILVQRIPFKLTNC